LDLDELEKFPERGIDVLGYCLSMFSYQNWRNPDPRWRKLSIELEEEWIDAREPLTRKAANRLLNELAHTHYGMEALRISSAAGKGGRPVKLRKAAIMALMWRHYLRKPWKEITLRVCPCGREHTFDLLLDECQPKLKVVVRILKRLLRELKITLPEKPTMGDPNATPNVEEWPHYEYDPEAVERPRNSHDDDED
jgi:hypothetical protein